MSTEPIDNKTVAATACRGFREGLEAQLAALDRVEGLLSRLPEEVIWHCHVRGNVTNVSGVELMFFGLSREEALSAIKALGGRWTKKVNPTYSDRLDYNQTIDGIPIEIYGAPPPESCRIEIEEIDVPAHKVTRRKLICT